MDGKLQHPPAVDVATYNVHRCIGIDGRHDPDRIAAVIRELDVDVIGLQEVDARAHVEAGVDQFDYLARATRFTAIAGPTLRRHQGHYGNLLLTRWPVREVEAVDLSVRGREPRGAIAAVVDTDRGAARVVVTHLGLRGRERRRQVALLLSLVGKHPSPRPAVLLGDFNEWLGPARVMRRLCRVFGSRAVRSFPSKWPLLALDRVLVYPARALTDVRAHRTRLARVASDHLPVRATIRRLEA